MPITIRYFASVREALGEGETVELALAAPTVADVLAQLQARSATHAEVLDPARGLRAARNLAFCQPDEPVVDGDELAFFPPVTGG